MSRSILIDIEIRFRHKRNEDIYDVISYADVFLKNLLI